MINPNEPRSLAKREVILRTLLRGTTVCLQETHWDEPAGNLWDNMFPGAEVAWTASRLGPRGGPQGGVAIIVPHGRRILDTHVDVPGCCLTVTILEPDGTS